MELGTLGVAIQRGRRRRRGEREAIALRAWYAYCAGLPAWALWTPRTNRVTHLAHAVPIFAPGVRAWRPFCCHDEQMSSDTPSDQEPPAQDIARAWTVLVPEAEEVAAQVARALVRRRHDREGEAGSVPVDELAANTRRQILLAILQLAHAGENDDERRQKRDTVRLWRDTGVRRARQHVPLETVLAYQALGTRLLWEALLSRRGHAHLSDGLLLAAGHQLWSALDAQSTVLVASYRGEEARLRRSDLQRRAGLFEALLAGRGADPAFAGRARAVLGLPEGPLVAVVAPTSSAEGDPFDHVEGRLHRAGYPSAWHADLQLHRGLVSLARKGRQGAAAVLLKCASGPVGTAVAEGGLVDVLPAFHLAERVASILPADAWTVDDVHDRWPDVLLASDPDVTPRLIDDVLGRLLALPDSQRDMLLQTLRALLDHNGSPTHAATTLTCHRNTVIYRQNQIEELTGRSLSVHRDRLLLSLAEIAYLQRSRRSTGH